MSKFDEATKQFGDIYNTDVGDTFRSRVTLRTVKYLRFRYTGQAAKVGETLKFCDNYENYTLWKTEKEMTKYSDERESHTFQHTESTCGDSNNNV